MHQTRGKLQGELQAKEICQVAIAFLRRPAIYYGSGRNLKLRATPFLGSNEFDNAQ
jgi:hypothetical protein